MTVLGKGVFKEELKLKLGYIGNPQSTMTTGEFRICIHREHTHFNDIKTTRACTCTHIHTYTCAHTHTSLSDVRDSYL